MVAERHDGHPLFNMGNVELPRGTSFDGAFHLAHLGGERGGHTQPDFRGSEVRIHGLSHRRPSLAHRVHKLGHYDRVRIQSLRVPVLLVLWVGLEGGGGGLRLGARGGGHVGCVVSGGGGARGPGWEGGGFSWFGCGWGEGTSTGGTACTLPG